jgi:hypothetical protein
MWLAGQSPIYFDDVDFSQKLRGYFGDFPARFDYQRLKDRFNHYIMEIEWNNHRI